MERYINFGGDADIIAFDIAADAIRVEFSSGDIYLYTTWTAGKENIKKMKNIAIRGGQLSRYISYYVKSGFDMRIREYRKVG